MISKFQASNLQEFLAKNQSKALELFFDKSVQGVPPVLLAAKMGDVTSTSELIQFCQNNDLGMKNPPPLVY